MAKEDMKELHKNIRDYLYEGSLAAKEVEFFLHKNDQESIKGYVTTFENLIDYRDRLCSSIKIKTNDEKEIELFYIEGELFEVTVFDYGYDGRINLLMNPPKKAISYKKIKTRKGFIKVETK